MPATPYVYERQIEYWTARGIETALLNSGFEVMVYPLSQLTEKTIPADFVFADSTVMKLFGFQFKTLYRNGADHWPLNKDQHSRLMYFPWIYYGMSELTSAREHRNALSYLKIYKPSFAYKPKLPRLSNQPAMRWIDFYEELSGCNEGCRVSDEMDLQLNLRPEEYYQYEQAARRDVNHLAEIATEIFAADFATKVVYRYSSSLA